MKRGKAFFTLDVEDWDHANYSQLAPLRAEISKGFYRKAYAMEKTMDRWMSLLEDHRVKATCFVLGEFARRYPSVVIKLKRAGHEIASHGYTHDLLSEMSRESFKEYLKQALGILGEITGDQPVGFRAPSWSADERRIPWFAEELEAQGILYDSSDLPVSIPPFNNGHLPTRPYRSGGVTRLPGSVVTLGKLRLPAGTGTFFRLFPRQWADYGLRQAMAQGRPPMIVLHPRELDPDHPKLPIRGLEGWTHYAFLKSTEPKLKWLFPRFEWGTLEDSLDSLKQMAGERHE